LAHFFWKKSGQNKLKCVRKGKEKIKLCQTKVLDTRHIGFSGKSGTSYLERFGEAVNWQLCFKLFA